MIKNVLFDLGGVLVDLSVQKSIRAMLDLMPLHQQKQGSSSAPVTGFDLLGGGESELMRQYQTGRITTAQFVDTIRSVCRPGTTQQQVLDAWFAMLGTIPAQRMQMLVRLKQAGYRIYVLSNINEAHVTWVAEHYPELLTLADQLFYSNEIGIAKPDAAAYAYVAEHAPLVPEETLYIDDLEQNIAAGRRAGFCSLLAEGDAWLPEAEKLINR